MSRGVLQWGGAVSGKVRKARSIREAGTDMADGIMHHFPDGTREQSAPSIAAVHPDGGQLPAGQLVHAAGPSAGSRTIPRRRALIALALALPAAALLATPSLADDPADPPPATDPPPAPDACTNSFACLPPIPDAPQPDIPAGADAT